jgi:hypothetical protein
MVSPSLRLSVSKVRVLIAGSTPNFKIGLEKIKVHLYSSIIIVGIILKADKYMLLRKRNSPQCCGFKSRQRLWILSCEEAIQVAYGMSVVLLRPLFMPEIRHRKGN